MLRALSIRDFVVVASLELEFEPGFSVLTGETEPGPGFEQLQSDMQTELDKATK